ncbi:MAG TPA: sugar ABC transporter ATP-binding protein [bacterium]|nr:sugar ABC transporter ATP-binding protein [bacterium]HQI49406.1 sugar ABC transporter ATP-binding protein [bacterium]
MSASPILEMRHIRRVFPGVVALDDVHFDLFSGEVHVLLGENGAGKSTLVRILSGALPAGSGEILLDGKAVRIDSARRAQQLGIASIYQELNLIPALTAAENIFLGREPQRYGRIDQRALNERAQAFLDELHAGIDARSRIRDLGTAQQQMVEVARALSLQARILIMDEPTSALTEQEIAALFALIGRLLKNGVAVIYISHRFEELYEIGNRVTILRDGRFIATRSVAGSSREELIRLMVDRKLEDFPRVKTTRGEEALRVEGLSRRGVLDDISFTLHHGEVMGIAGLLGSGRTELARAIFGADPIDRGRILVHGRAVRIPSPRVAIQLGIGLLTEDRKHQGLVLGLPVTDNITLPSLNAFSRLGWIRRKAEHAAAANYAGRLHIRALSLGQPVRYLSGGNQQKVVLSKWLCSHAMILLFDEPTRGIDVGAKFEIYHLLNQLAADGAAILMISSELPEILGLSDRILVMCRGRIAAEFPTAAATPEKILSYALGEN